MCENPEPWIVLQVALEGNEEWLFTGTVFPCDSLESLAQRATTLLATLSLEKRKGQLCVSAFWFCKKCGCAKPGSMTVAAVLPPPKIEIPIAEGIAAALVVKAVEGEDEEGTEEERRRIFASFLPYIRVLRTRRVD